MQETNAACKQRMFSRVCDPAAGMSAIIPSSQFAATTTTTRTNSSPGIEEDSSGSSRSSSNSSSLISSVSLADQHQEQEGLLDERLQKEEQQVDQQDHDEQSLAEEDLLVEANDQFPNFGLVSFIGRRKEMEDTATVVSDFLSLPCDISRHSAEPDRHSLHHFFGVYDGHGGSQVALFCKNRLHHALAEELEESMMRAGCASAGEVRSWDPVWERAMESCFLKVDGEIGSMCLKPGNCDKCEANTGVCSETVGSTAVVAVVGCCRIIVANCGDSRVVLSRGGKALPLSTDHKPEREDEMQRIEDAGGKVIFWNGYRVNGMLAMSRAIGDRYLERLVIPNPDIQCIRRCEEDEFIVLASDGLWDVLSNEQVCDLTRMCLAGKCNSNVDALASYMHGTANTQARLAAAYLTKLAYNRRSSDNISVVVVDLKTGQSAAVSSPQIAASHSTPAPDSSTTTTTAAETTT